MESNMEAMDAQLQKFCAELWEMECPDDSKLDALLENVLQAFDLDVVYVLEALVSKQQFYFSHYITKDAAMAYDGRAMWLDEEEYNTALNMYDSEGLCDYNIKDFSQYCTTKVLHYGFISSGIYQGSVGFQRSSGLDWTAREREFLKRLGRILKFYVYSRRIERQESWNSQRPISALESSYECILVVSLSTDTYHAAQIKDRIIPVLPVNGPYYATICDYIEADMEPAFREDAFYRLTPQYIASRLTGKERSFDLDYQRISNGQHYWTRLSVVLMDRTPEGGVDHVLITTQDITAQFREQELQNTAFSLMRGSYCRILYADLTDNTCVNLQSIAEEAVQERELGSDLNLLFQYACENYITPEFQPNFRELLAPEHLKNLFDSGVPFVELSLCRFVRGVPTWVRMEVIPLEDYTPDRARCMWYTHNISEQKMMEDNYQNQLLQVNARLRAALTKAEELRQQDIQARTALKDAYQVANHANKAKSEFLSRMSHDIRTPLNAIIGMTAIAGAHLDDRERMQDCLTKITASSRHLLSLINEVLDMSKIESGKIDLNEEPFNLPDLVDDLSTMIQPQIAEKHHTLNIQIDGVEHEKVIGDSLRLQQSFTNLMSNAIKYTPDGGKIDLLISEKPCRQAQFGCYEFIFRDNGIGMTPEFVKHIFEPFSRAQEAQASKIQGTGLGMAITYNLVRMMNGTIRVESTPGVGSTFTLTLFLRLQEGQMDDYEEFCDLPVLVADDDEITCQTACGILSELGIDSEWVLSGREAVQKVIERHRIEEDYFAVILDWKMPDMDGLATTRAIRAAAGDDVPIIIISAYDWSEIEQEARLAGANGFISKPLFKSRFAYLFQGIIHSREGGEAENPSVELSTEEFTDKRVLLAEDNDLNAEIAIEILGMLHVEAVRVENGEEAVERFRQSKPGTFDLIFMDIQMPVMDGYEAVKRIRELERPDAKSIPVIAMTANAFTEDIQRSIAAGMNAHLPKPLDFKQLTETLRKWL